MGPQNILKGISGRPEEKHTEEINHIVVGKKKTQLWIAGDVFRVFPWRGMSPVHPVLECTTGCAGDKQSCYCGQKGGSNHRCISSKIENQKQNDGKPVRLKKKETTTNR
jgi:hypothetical protein